MTPGPKWNLTARKKNALTFEKRLFARHTVNCNDDASLGAFPNEYPSRTKSGLGTGADNVLTVQFRGRVGT